MEKYSIQTMIFWSLYAFIWFRNIEKNAVANDKCVFATCTYFKYFMKIKIYCRYIMLRDTKTIAKQKPLLPNR
jgi:hypothetical protein